MDFNISGKMFDFARGFRVAFDKEAGLSPGFETGKRDVSDMNGMYADAAAETALIEGGNPLVYAFHSMPAPEHAGDLCFGCSIVNPGKVGDEYYMTRGHFHAILDTAEVYYCLSGQGYMLSESGAGDWNAHELRPGQAVYVPKGYAHRSICVGVSEPLVTFYVLRADAGHDYGAIETKGFRKLLVERDGKPAVIDNPRWGK